MAKDKERGDKDKTLATNAVNAIVYESSKKKEMSMAMLGYLRFAMTMSGYLRLAMRIATKSREFEELFLFAKGLFFNLQSGSSSEA